MQAHPLFVDSADMDAGPRRLIFVMLAVFVLFVAVAGGWMALAHIDVAVQARGAVIAPSRLQEVASLEGGIVHRVLVKAGDRVKRGQPLVELNRAQYDADLGESVESRRSLEASRIRYDALLSGRAPDFSALQAQAPVLVREELRLWQEAQRQYQVSLAVPAEGVRRREAEVVEARSRIANLVHRKPRHASRCRSRSGCTRKVRARALTIWPRSSAGWRRAAS